MPTELLRKQFLLTAEENELIEAQAKAAGLSVSNYTRKLYKLPPLQPGKKPKSEKKK